MDARTGVEVHPGATVTSFRGEDATLLRPTTTHGGSGKVYVEWASTAHRHEYYGAVFGLAVRD